MLTPRNFVSIALLLLFSAGITSSVRAETAGFPKDKPAFTVDVPSGWTVTHAPDGSFLMVGDGMNNVSFLSVPAGSEVKDKATASAAIAKLIERDMKDGKDQMTVTDPAEVTIAGNKAYSVKINEKASGTLILEITLFSADGKAYFASSATGDVSKIMASIKAEK
jgi:hypothetical protein